MINSNLNLLNSEYQSNLNLPLLKNVRGSVRLIFGKILTPENIELKFKEVISKKLL